MMPRTNAFMKAICVYMVFALLPHLSFARVDESGPGNGTDYVKVLFADAQYEILRLMGALESKDIAALEIDANIKSWLLAIVDGKPRFEQLRRYLRVMELSFQAGPCSDFTGKPASICFFRDPEAGPYVMISLEQNRFTLKEQAMAMLIHEAGHFTGEKDHLFLDKVGVQLVAAVKFPKLLLSEAQSVELVPNVFLAKDQCESGASKQAQILRQQAEVSLLSQCDQRGARCETANARYIYQGEPEFKEGQGYTMKVKCTVKGILDLRR